jgi:hypothetical protein
MELAKFEVRNDMKSFAIFRVARVAIAMIERSKSVSDLWHLLPSEQFELIYRTAVLGAFTRLGAYHLT